MYIDAEFHYLNMFSVSILNQRTIVAMSQYGQYDAPLYREIYDNE
jgi:hypothetical protein